MNQEVIGKCSDYTHDGQGIVKIDGRPIFVEGLFIGEEAKIEILFNKSDYAIGKIIKLLNLSPDRITPRCPVATACGGCSFQALAYPAQLAFKKRKVSEALRKIGGIDAEVDEVVGMENPYFYRNKTQMPVGYDKQNRLVSGFYRRFTHTIVPIEKCYIEDERSSSILANIKLAMKENKIMAYNEDTRVGVIRHVLIKTSQAFKDIMVVLVTNFDSFPGRNNLVKSIKEKCPEVTTIVQNINLRDTNVILGEKENVLFGKGFIKDELHGLAFNISSKSFYQVNPIQASKLYDLAMQKAGLTGDEIVIDAYCGVGTISLIASKFAKEVIGVEIVKEAVEDAIRNARLNNITNTKFFTSDASQFIENLIQQGTNIDVVFVDPPRKGLEDSFVKSLLKLKPQKIVYVSCEPSTLARDLKLLKESYNVQSVSPVDMFPMTYHVETITLLSLK